MKTINSLRSKLLALTLALIASVSSVAYDFQVDGLNYTITSSVDPYTVEVTKNISDNGNNYEGYTSITIPKSVLHNGVKYQVTGIGKEAFLYTSVSEFTIPETVKYIAESAFGGSFELTSIEIPNSVTDIGSAAFTSSDKLTSVILGDGVTTIGPLAFMGCRALQTINIPESVTAISALAFYDCPKITDVKLNNGLVEIKDQAFSYTNITSIEIPKSVTILGLNPFSYIPSLTKMSVKKGHPLFNSDPNSNAIIETATNTLVAGCRYSIVPNTITVVGKAAFMGCKGRIELSLPNSVKTINDSAYFGCIDLISIDIPNSVTTIGSEAFSWCTSATSLTIGENVNSIGGRAFWGCEKIKTVTCNAIVVPNLGEDVFGYMFGGNIHLATLYVPAESVEAYKTAAQWKEFGQILPIEQTPEDLFPTLWGLQRTSCTKTIGEDEYGTVWGSRSYLMQEIETATIDGKQYLLFGTNNIDDEYCSFWLREENNKILVYSTAQKKDLVLYDFTLNVGDLLPRLYVDFELSSVVDYYKYMEGYASTDPLVVTEVSTITLLDGKEYKKWTFNNGMQYVERIGSFGTSYGHNDFYQLIVNAPLYSDVHSQHLVCVSKDGKLLYQMDDAEMERLGAECLCDVETSYKDQWCNKWNVMWFDGLFFDETASTSQYRLGKDTIIGDYTYSKFTSRTSVRFTSDRKVYVYYEGFDDNDPYTVDLPTGEYLAYDFSAQVGDTLEVFSGVGTYSTYSCVVDDVEAAPSPCVVDDVQADLKTFPLIIKLRPLCDVDGEGNLEISSQEITWIEGVGSPDGFLISNPPCGLVGGGTFALLCAYKGDELKYTGSLYDEYGCEYNATEQNPEDLFPTLWGLQRTHTIEMYDYAPNDGKRSGGYPLPFASVKDTVINGKTYLQFGDHVNGSNYSLFFLREENNKVLIYSSILQNDLVLYDYTLKLGDSLPAITSDHDYFSDDHFTKLDKAENIFTYVVTDVSTITLLDGIERKKWTLQNQYLGIMEYVEGIGCFGEKNSHSGDFFRLIYDHPYKTEYVGDHLVCVSKNGQLLYSMPQEEMNSFTLTCECLSQEDTIAPKDLFPTLWGLQRTSCDEWFDGCEENKSYLFAPKEITEINGKQYLKCGGVFLREEDSKVLIYSFPYEKDLVLYDYTLEVGDTLQNLGIDIYSFPELEYAAVVDYIAYEDYDVETDEFIIKKEPLGSKRVTEVSTITLLDGKEYKRWLFGNDWENGNYYVEGIGNVGGSFGGDYINIANPYGIPTCYLGERLVCASKNNKLLYQMDPVKMDELGAECLCDYDRGPRKDNAKDGQIGGRPTPTQWNQLEVVLRQMDNNHTILQAETFSYTLEDISQQVNNKTYFQLARQSTKDTATTKSVVGALHFGKDEDNRVYFLRDGVEYVLYDFTAEIGDTVEIFAGINNYPQETTYTHVVVDKDTTEDGACRMFLEVVFPDETTTATNAEKVWLAGLGSVDGIVHNAAKRTSNAHAAPSRSASSSETESSVMLCAWREDSCLYTTNHPDYDTFGCVYNQDPTAVEDISTSQSSYQKLLRDGQLFIIHDGKTYNVLGVPVE